MKITVDAFKQALFNIADKIEQEKDYLSELDRALGDGDHGVTMSIGWQAIKRKLAELKDQQDFGEICKAVGMTFLNAVGSSVGPLYATAFLRGGAAIQGKMDLDQDDVITFWVAAVNGIQERGKARVGEKTMLDTWIPAVEALQKAHRGGKDFITCLEEAVLAGEKGMKSTADMLSQKGRSSRLGDRSLGHQDPGATSAYIILSSFLESMKCLQNV
jgi:dihydroxyacetone kinase-like protein